AADRGRTCCRRTQRRHESERDVVSSRMFRAAFALAILAGGCTTLLGINKDYQAADDGGTTGETGGGGATGPSASSATGGASGTGGSGAGGSGAASGSGGAMPCPQAKGPAMVDLGAFCIDTTEVTNTHYAAFLAANVPLQSVSHDPSTCTWNTSY